MKRKIRAGTTSLSLPVIVYDNTSTTGAGLSGITHASSGLVFEYRRQGQSSWTSVTPVSKTLGTYTSGGIVASGSRAGRYEIDIPDAAVAAGARFVEVCLRGVANMHPVDIEIELDAVDYQSATNFGLSKFADIETDTQDIQSRLPSALIGGRMDATVGEFQAGLVPANFAALGIQVGGQITSVGTVDELGPTALTANSLDTDIANKTWNALTTATWATDSFGKHVLISSGAQRTVAVTGSNHVAADIHELQPGVIAAADFDATALTAIADGVLGRATSTSTYDAGDVGYVLRQVYSMIVADGSDWQYTANALELAPAGGGGGGGTDWTSSERTAIRSILGFNTSGVIIIPSDGVLDAIKDKTDLITSGSVQTSLPVTASGQITGPLFIGDDYLNANGRAFSWTVALPTGYVLGTSTCRLGMQYMDESGSYSFVVTGTVIDAGGGNVTLRFDVPRATTETLAPGWYRWSVEHRDAAGVEITRVASGIKKEVEWREKQT